MSCRLRMMIVMRIAMIVMMIAMMLMMIFPGVVSASKWPGPWSSSDAAGGISGPLVARYWPGHAGTGLCQVSVFHRPSTCTHHVAGILHLHQQLLCQSRDRNYLLQCECWHDTRWYQAPPALVVTWCKKLRHITTNIIRARLRSRAGVCSRDHEQLVKIFRWVRKYLNIVTLVRSAQQSSASWQSDENCRLLIVMVRIWRHNATYSNTLLTIKLYS